MCVVDADDELSAACSPSVAMTTRRRARFYIAATGCTSSSRRGAVLFANSSGNPAAESVPLLRYVVFFAIERRASGEDQVPQNVLLTFALEFSVNALLTSPVLIWWSRLGLPALAVALLRRHLPEPDTTSVGDDRDGGGDRADDGAGELAHGASAVKFAQRWRRRGGRGG